MSLVLKNVSKSFVGKKAVENISFSLTKPGVYGLLGTNGAGKITTIRMLLGIIKKDSGEITWKGKAVDRKSVRFGYLPEERGVYPKTKIFDQLMYFAELKGMKKNEAVSSINKWAKELKVEEYLQMPAEKLSKGNQQKIQFMTAIIHNPELVVLDEPFSGLDPVNTEILKNIIIDLIRNGKYIIMSAHQMATIEENTTMMNEVPEECVNALTSIYSNLKISKLGLTEQQLQSIIPNFEFNLEQTEEKSASGNVFVMMIMSIVLFYAIYFCAYQVSSSITTEKTSKIIETLATSTSPKTIVLGKTKSNFMLLVK